MEKALLAMLLKTVREIERQKPGTIDLLRNALDVLEAEREARMKAEPSGSPSGINDARKAPGCGEDP